ncbi:elongation factor-like GTPase 1 isoform X1 [Lucilia cuprina]|uniref:elongation factor-like GTPase 1 isoform X1 n=2 Tax=Lucilia TaxID=7374 RepID=UPI001F0584BF|nr:elongation factor-like GTPase 1 isoform X1 [Lucilia cuprina]
MPIVDTGDLVNLQKNIESVRNICILAHVDHGKTTLADSLVASNGIISQRMAGKLRYLDNRQDEQERGITMKSSSISLFYQSVADHRNFLVNLIDSPGHVDFSSEVSTAVRLCDGAIVVVDVVEGVCPQTRACLQQVYVEQLKPVLVLNKIDRLILEKQMTPLDAYFHITQVLEQVNAVLGSIFASDVLAKEDISHKDNYESALEDSDDSHLYFSPASGNVAFCSAYDGWAFRVRDFAATYAEKLEMSIEDLEQVLWGDYFYNAKKKCAIAGAQEKAKKPMFVQFVLENIWSLYDTIVVRKDKDKIPVIAEKLGIKLLARDLRVGDPKAQIKTVLGQWLPIDRTILEMVVKHVPAPNSINDDRAQRLLYPENVDLNTYPSESLVLKEDFKKCDAQSSNIIVFVSKMTPVHVTQLPQNKPKRLTDQELQARRDEVRKRIEERKQLAAQSTEVESITAGVQQMTTEEKQQHEEEEKEKAIEQKEEEEKPEFVFIAFARIFSGTLKKGMKLYNLAPKHDPRNKDSLSLDSPYITEVTIGDLYLFMGGELQALDEVPAGNIVGIGGLEQSIVKTSTLSSTMYCTSFSELSVMATPIFRVAIEPVNPSEMPKLIKGLKLLNQADACVQVSLEATGEHVITTLGEVHVEKCVHDLQESYAKIKVNVSKPIVSFRETIVPEATVDMVNEAIVKTSEDKDISKKIVTMTTLNKLSTIKVIALPLPQNVIDIIEKYQTFIKEFSTTAKLSNVSEKSRQLLQQVKSQLSTAFKDFDTNGLTSLSTEELIARIWSLGPRHCGSNILLNLSDYEHPSFWWPLLNSTEDLDSPKSSDVRRDYNSSFVNGFQLTTSAGPLCEEPMQGVCFVVLEWSVEASDELNSKAYGPFSGQVLTASKEACRQAFQNQPQRLVSPMYSCNIVVNAEVLGKMYAVIGKRHGKILSGDLTQGSGNFSVMAILPVIESFNFAQEIRKQTSGLACPQLMFSHWEVIDIDPFWVPTTEEEFMHFGEKADSANRAKLYMDSVRRRKGLYVDEKVVEHAEKQRTLSKKK